MKPEDSGRKVTCKINDTLINDGELYYCPEEGDYYIFQNEKGGATTLSISPKERGYKYSWHYFDPSKNWISHAVTEFKFKEENIVNEKLFKDLEDMSNRKAEFTDYFHKTFEIFYTKEGNLRGVLLYKLLSDIRDIGYEQGKRAEKEELLKFLNNR